MLPTLTHTHTWLIGASASVMAIVIGIAVKAPHYKINLLFLGPISLKWIAIAYVIIDILSITGNNMGGHIAHLGGAITGAVFTILINKGIDITHPINWAIDQLINIYESIENASLKNKIKNNKQSKNTTNASSHCKQQSSGTISQEDEVALDIILDKIKKSGYASLTEEEKRRLFQVSKNK